VPSKAGTSRPSGTAISIRAERDVREDVGTPSFTPASLFVAFALLRLPAPSTVSRLRREGCITFREPLQFIVISVMGII
jgi:hypothetical protein